LNINSQIKIYFNILLLFLFIYCGFWFQFYRCFDKLDYLNLTITSSIFEENRAQNGGAIYFNEGINDENNNNNNNINNNNNNNNSITIKDTTFKNNIADYFGGAIYSDYEELYITNIENVEFISNKAYSGGAIYTSNNKNKTLFDVYNKNINYIDNIAESHGNDYATDPYMINLINENIRNIVIKSGSTFSLEFDLKDQFNQYVNDISKYYSNIGLETYITNDNINQTDYAMLKNTCYFYRGISFL